MTAAADGATARIPNSTDWRISIANAPGLDAYPIAFLTWIIAYRHPESPETAQSSVSFLQWSLRDGQSVAASLDYAPLPAAMLERLRPRVDSIAVR